MTTLRKTIMNDDKTLYFCPIGTYPKDKENRYSNSVLQRWMLFSETVSGVFICETEGTSNYVIFLLYHFQCC